MRGFVKLSVVAILALVMLLTLLVLVWTAAAQPARPPYHVFTGGVASPVSSAPTAGDQVPVSDSATGVTWQTLPNCTDATGNHLNYTAATNTYSCGTSSSTSSGVSGCNVRLTATSGVPVTTGDVTGATTLYVTPFHGNKCLMADSTTVSTVSEVPVALGTLSSGKPYDVFCYDNSGVLACDPPVAWTDGTTRATAVVLSNGVYVKSGATSRLYIGTFYTTATTTTEDSVNKRYVWNYYNRVLRPLQRFETTSSWTYNSATLQQANASTSNQVNVVVGLLEDTVSIRVAVTCGSATNGGTGVTAIGEDSTNTSLAASMIVNWQNVFSQNSRGLAEFTGFPSSVGRHFYAWLEASGAGQTETCYGANGATPETARSGMTGWVMG